MSRQVIEVIRYIAVGIMQVVAFSNQVAAPRLPVHRTVVVTACGPAEQVDPTCKRFRNLFVVFPDKIILMLRETPGSRRSLILQVAF